jgi:OOP family OmpA-OmpF porin
MLNKKNIVAVTLSTVTSLVLATSAHAAVSGPYLGGDLGWGTIHQTSAFKQFGIPNSDNTDNGIAGRVFGGVKFNEYIGAEMGYTKFSNQTSKVNTLFASGNEKIQSYAVDLVAKGTLPLQNGFSLFGKLGVAYLNQDMTLTAEDAFVSETATANVNKVLPTFGAGISYEINSNLTTDISWMHIQQVGNDVEFGDSGIKMQNTDFVGLGLTYNFG